MGVGATHLVGVTELGWMLGNDPNLALAVLYGLGRWEAGRSGGGMDPQRRGWVRGGEVGGESSSSSSGARTPPPRPPPKAPKKHKTPRYFESSEEEAPPPRTPPQAQGQGQARPPNPPPLENRGRDPHGNVPGVGDTWYVPWAEGGNGGNRQPIDGVGGLG